MGSMPKRLGILSRTISTTFAAPFSGSPLDKIEVCRLVTLGPFGHLAAVDAAGVDNDPAFRRLSKHLG